MNALANFFASDTGQFMAALFIIVGLSNMFFPFVIFGRKIRHHHSKLHPELTAEEKAALESQIKALRCIQRAIIATGLLLLVIGAIGLASSKGA